MAESFKVTSIQGTDDDATVTIEQVAVHVEGKPVVSRHPAGRTGVTMNDFNYQGAETVFLDMKGLGSSTGESLRHAIAAFLADNELWVMTGNTVTDTVPLSFHKTAPEYLTLGLPEYVRAGGSDA